MKEFMLLVIEEGRKGVKCGDGGPFGAVVIRENKIISKAHNTVIQSNDPTAHAEINAIRLASQHLNNFNLSECTLFTSSEPCPMCLAAIMWSGIKTVYYGCTVKDADRIGFADQFMYEYLKDPNTKQSILKLEPFLREEALSTFEMWVQKEDKITY